MCTSPFTKASVRFNVAGIALKILTRTELNGIDEVTDNNAVIFSDGAYYKTPVSFMTEETMSMQCSS